MLTFLKPRELKIEITNACNMQCTFCYHGDETHHGVRYMQDEEVLGWIDWTVDNNIPAVRFTGGEATLNTQIEMFCCYAHLRGRYVVLNTNGMADHSLYEKLFAVTDDVRISMPTLDAGRMDELTGGTDVLKKKMGVIELALEAGVSRVGVLTALLPELQGSLENFIRFSRISTKLFWMPLRYESTPVIPRPWKPADAQAFAEEMAYLMDRYPREAQGVFLATPFCAVTPIDLGARVFHGRTEDCGPFVALNVNARGRIEACFGVGEMENAPSFAEIRDCPEIRACTSIGALPDECRNCEYVGRCAGGCRKPCGLMEHNGKWVDYLAGFLYNDIFDKS